MITSDHDERESSAMNVERLITEDHIIMDLQSTESSDCIVEMTRTLDKTVVNDRTELISSILGREQLAPTGIENGIAIPHTKTDAVRKPALVIGRSRKGIEFHANDGKPSHLIFLLLLPARKKGMLFSLMSGIIKCVKDAEKREHLLDANDARTLMEHLGATRTFNIKSLLEQEQPHQNVPA